VGRATGAVKVQGDAKDRAARYWRPLAARLGLADDIFERLVAAYGEPHRRYHTLDHIVEMLDCLDESRHLAANEDALALAVWFHDAVYESTVAHGASEAASADLLSALCPVDAAPAAHAMILHSVHHGPSDDPDTQLFCDLDLYRLAGPLETFLRHGDDVRAEYDWVSDEAWAHGRASFMGGLQKRPVIYQTAYWRARLEADARRNIAYVLENMS
jgi:predicted metal-dependent HD superfamily phosphohydrolase